MYAVLHLRRNKWHQHMLGGTQLEGRFAEKDLGILVDTNLNTNQQHTLALKAANYSWMHQAKYQQQGERQSFLSQSFSNSALVRLHLGCWV